MSSNEVSVELHVTERSTLIAIARGAIERGVLGESPIVAVEELTTALCVTRATFITLMQDGALRGCIGTLDPYRPLAVDVAENAYAAAFRDPRFPPVVVDEVPRLDVHISILNPPERLAFVSEDDLIQQLRPGLDGLTLKDGPRSATFLPSVWESVRDPREFLRHLKYKAGLPLEGWSPTIRAERYTVSSIP